jgi:hypothetical protein
VNRIINDAGDRPDQLPLLQHALMRTWKFAQKRANGDDSALTVSEDDYRNAGGIENALSLHADAAWATIANNKRKADIARHLFLLLCDVSPDGQITRRRPKLAQVEAVTGASITEIQEVIRLFQDDDRNFLLPPQNEELSSETELDVSHEALLRQWNLFANDWLVQERYDTDELRSLVKQANDRRRGRGGLLGEQDLIRIADWKKRSSLQWARRYVPAGMWNEGLRFVEESEDEAERARKEELLRKAERQRAREEEILRKAERERVKLLLRQRNFAVIVVVLGLIVLIALAALGYLIDEKRKAWKQTAAELEKQRQALVEKARNLTENARTVLASETDPIRDVTALRNLALALNMNPQDIEAAKMARNLLLQRVWCPPAASEVRYRRDTLLAAAFAPGGSNNEIFAATGDGQLLFWNGREMSPVRSLFEKLKPSEREVVQPALASFSPNGQWLFIIAPTLASAAIAEGPDARHEPCRVQIWRWSLQKGTYESAGEDLEFQRLRGSRLITFAWSPESDRVVLINTRLNETKSVFFELKGNTFQPLLEQSNKLNSMKIVALTFAAYRTGIAAVSVDPAAPALRKISLISADDLQVMPKAIYGRDSIQLLEGFQPNDVDFGPGNDQLTLTSWSGIRILDLLNGNVISVPPPSFRDQFMRIVVGPGDFARRLVATSLYGRVEVAKATRMQEPAEPAVFHGSIGVAQFSSDGQRLLILSGGIWNVFDRMRLIDVSALYRTLEPAPEKFEEEPVPRWLADIASAVSALDTTGDGSLLTLEGVQQRYPESKAGDPYEAVWKRFFPNQRTPD